MSSDFYFFRPLGAKQDNLYINHIDAVDRSLVAALSGDYHGVVIKCELPAGLDWLVPFAEKVKALTLELPCEDVGAINRLTALEKLHLPQYCAGIEFARLGHLHEVELSDCKFPTALFETCDLKVLTLARVKGVDIAELPRFTRLASLEINVSNVTTLRGMGRMETLREMYLAQLPLADLAGIELQRGLRTVRLSYMKKLADISALDNLPALDELMCVSCKQIPTIDHAIAPDTLGGFIFIDGGRLGTISGLAGNRNLDTIDFSGATVVADGKVRFLADLPKLAELRFEDRRHYDAKWDDFQARLKPRSRPPRGKFAAIAFDRVSSEKKTNDVTK
jgi:hypothetical protein